jgi:hypothetical protein
MWDAHCLATAIPVVVVVLKGQAVALLSYSN